MMGQQDGSLGKGVCHQAWQFEFDSCDPYGRREPTLKSYSLPAHALLWKANAQAHTYTKK